MASTAEKDAAKLLKHRFLPAHPYAIFLSSAGDDLLYRVAVKNVKISVRNDLARIAIALELYRREHKKYPHSLTELSPQYMRTLPVDSYTGTPCTITF